VGSAALSTVELSADRNIASMRPTNMRIRPRLVSCDALAGALVVLGRVVVMGLCGLPLGSCEGRQHPSHILAQIAIMHKCRIARWGLPNRRRICKTCGHIAICDDGDTGRPRWMDKRMLRETDRRR
jgi:hypothetical protein